MKNNSGYMTASNRLYNGNISKMISAIKPFMTNNVPQGMAYGYDQLNRLVHAEAWNNVDPINNEFEYEHRFIIIPDTFKWIYPINYNVESISMTYEKRIQPDGGTAIFNLINVPFKLSGDTLLIFNDSLKNHIPKIDESYFLTVIEY